MIKIYCVFIIGTGNTVIKAIAVLKEHNVLEENIILSNLFCTPIAAKSLVTAFPKVSVLLSIYDIKHIMYVIYVCIYLTTYMHTYIYMYKI